MGEQSRSFRFHPDQAASLLDIIAPLDGEPVPVPVIIDQPVLLEKSNRGLARLVDVAATAGERQGEELTKFAFTEIWL